MLCVNACNKRVYDQYRPICRHAVMPRRFTNCFSPMCRGFTLASFGMMRNRSLTMAKICEDVHARGLQKSFETWVSCPARKEKASFTLQPSSCLLCGTNIEKDERCEALKATSKAKHGETLWKWLKQREARLRSMCYPHLSTLDAKKYQAGLYACWLLFGAPESTPRPISSSPIMRWGLSGIQYLWYHIIRQINLKNTPTHTHTCNKYKIIYYTFLIISLHIDSTCLTYIATWFNCYLATKCTREGLVIHSRSSFYLLQMQRHSAHHRDPSGVIGCFQPKVVCQWELTQMAPWLGHQCPWPRPCNWFRSEEMVRFEIGLK